MATPIVQFSAPIQYADEGDVAKIEVMRIGSVDQTCVVRYMPVGSHMEGTKFHPCRGELEFGPGDLTKTFDLVLMDEKSFDSVVELPFKLEAVSNCEVGKYNDVMRVKVIDDDVFPSAKFKAETIKDPTCDSWRDGKDWHMLWEVVKLCISINSWGAAKIMIGDQISNAIFIGQLQLGKILINALSGADPGLQNRQGILIIAAGLTLPYAYNHWLGYRKQFWKVGGMVREEMMDDLMIRILYYKESTRDEIEAEEVQGTFSHHIFEIVSEGYMQVFPIAMATGRIFLVMLFFVFSASHYWMLACFGAVPLAACFFMKLRGRQNSKARKELEDSRTSLADYVDSVIDHYRVIADSWARPIVMKKCSRMIKRVNKSLVVQGSRQANDIAFFGWTTEVVEAFAVIVGGFLVLEGGTTLGGFTSTLAGLRSATGQYALMYEAALKIQSTFPGMWLLCQYMNMPMDLNDRKDIAVDRLKRWQPKLEQACTDERVQRGEQVAQDVVPLQLEDVTFEFPSVYFTTGSRTLGGHRAVSTNTVTVLRNIDLSIEQGHLVGITGPSGEGKGTLLRVLAEVLLPSNGRVFVPSHLLVHHLDLQDYLYDGSVADNVFFALMARKGITSIDDLEECELKRGVAVCQSLGMSDDAIKAVKDPSGYIGPGTKGFSKSMKVKVQIARALVANPEVLVVHLPVDSFSKEQGNVVFKQLRDFVRSKGVNMDPEGFSQRRPRTCIFTSNKFSTLKQCDKVYSVVKGHLSEGIWAGADEGPDVGRGPEKEGQCERYGDPEALIQEPVDATPAGTSETVDSLEQHAGNRPISV